MTRETQSGVAALAALTLLLAALCAAAPASAAKLKETKRIKLAAVEESDSDGGVLVRVRSPWRNKVSIEELTGKRWTRLARSRPAKDGRLTASATPSVTTGVVRLRATVKKRRAASRITELDLGTEPGPQPEPEPPIEPPLPKGVPIGFNNNAVDQRIATPAQAADLLATAGAKVDRVQIGWDRLERSPGNYDFSLSDAIYHADVERGVKPLFILAFAPRWASGSTCQGVTGTCHAGPAPEFYDDFARAAAALAKRYPEAAGIEVWNEPNIGHYWRPVADPEAYARLLMETYATVRAVAPQMPIAGGSVVNHYPPNPDSLDGPAFLKRVFEAGATGAMDVISLHAYARGNVTGEPAVHSLGTVRNIRDWFGDPETPLWVTETGSSTTGRGLLSEADQAVALTALDTRLRSEPDVEMVLVHTLIDAPRGPNDQETGFGVVRPDLTKKPGYCTLALGWGRPDAC
jgi:hypothetical protein